MNCISCNKPIPEGRLKALPKTTTCVNCSTTGKKMGVPRQYGEGEDTFTELDIMEEDIYKVYERYRYTGKIIPDTEK